MRTLRVREGRGNTMEQTGRKEEDLQGVEALPLGALLPGLPLPLQLADLPEVLEVLHDRDVGVLLHQHRGAAAVSTSGVLGLR